MPQSKNQIISKVNTKLSQSIPNGREIYQNIPFQNLPKLWFLVSKYTIWQPCLEKSPCLCMCLASGRRLCHNAIGNDLAAIFDLFPANVSLLFFSNVKL
jgi:hypothetical protein